MILINSISQDCSTNEVIDWLTNYNSKLLRINIDSKILEISILQLHKRYS